MACQVIFEFRIKDGCHDTLKQHLKEILPDTRDFPGCLTVHMVQDIEDPAKVVLLEQWECAMSRTERIAIRDGRSSGQQTPRRTTDLNPKGRGDQSLWIKRRLVEDV